MSYEYAMFIESFQKTQGLPQKLPKSYFEPKNEGNGVNFKFCPKNSRRFDFYALQFYRGMVNDNLKKTTVYDNFITKFQNFKQKRILFKTQKEKKNTA